MNMKGWGWVGTGLSRFQMATKGRSPSRDMFPYWPPVCLSTQGDPGIPTAEHREAADWPGRNKGPTLPSQPPRATWPPRVPILRHLRSHQPEDSGQGSFVVGQRSSLPWGTEAQPPLSWPNGAVADSVGQVGRTRVMNQVAVSHTKGLTE